MSQNTLAITELSPHELDEVSGGIFGLLGGTLLAVGNLAYGINYSANVILNTRLINSVGAALSKFGGPVGQAIHVTPDVLGYTVFKTVDTLAKAVGGPETGKAFGPVPYHYETHLKQGWDNL